jgi:hypothetical protein
VAVSRPDATVLNGKVHKVGASQETYTGQWLRGEKEGQGVAVEGAEGGSAGPGKAKALPGANGLTVHRGQWSGGAKEGVGHVEQRGGAPQYLGQWSLGLMNGRGTLVYVQASLCSCLCVLCLLVVPLQCPCSASCVFVSVVCCVLPSLRNSHCPRNLNGALCHRYKSGDRYEGEWLDGQRQGEGRLVRVAGQYQGRNSEYEGQWSGDCRHGRGEERFENGDVYDGEWEEDQRHGEGVLTHANNKVDA